MTDLREILRGMFHDLTETINQLLLLSRVQANPGPVYPVTSVWNEGRPLLTFHSMLSMLFMKITQFTICMFTSLMAHMDQMGHHRQYCPPPHHQYLHPPCPRASSRHSLRRPSSHHPRPWVPPSQSSPKSFPQITDILDAMRVCILHVFTWSFLF